MTNSHKVAIIVAIITALGGIVTAFIAKNSPPNKESATYSNSTHVENSTVGGDVVGGNKISKEVENDKKY